MSWNKGDRVCKGDVCGIVYAADCEGDNSSVVVVLNGGSVLSGRQKTLESQGWEVVNRAASESSAVAKRDPG
jgi:hypothetical protein